MAEQRMLSLVIAYTGDSLMRGMYIESQHVVIMVIAKTIIDLNTIG